MNPEQIQQEAESVYPIPDGGFWTATQKYHVEKLREAYKAGRLKSDEQKDKRIADCLAAWKSKDEDLTYAVNRIKELEDFVKEVSETHPDANPIYIIKKAIQLLTKNPV